MTDKAMAFLMAAKEYVSQYVNINEPEEGWNERESHSLDAHEALVVAYRALLAEADKGGDANAVGAGDIPRERHGCGGSEGRGPLDRVEGPNVPVGKTDPMMNLTRATPVDPLMSELSRPNEQLRPVTPPKNAEPRDLVVHFERGEAKETIARWLAALREHQKEDEAREKRNDLMLEAAIHKCDELQSRRFTPEEREALDLMVALAKNTMSEGKLPIEIARGTSFATEIVETMLIGNQKGGGS